MNAPLYSASSASLALDAAPDARRPPRRTRLLHVDPHGGPPRALGAGGLAELLEPGDVVVVNDAGTLPAVMPVHGGGELRLLAQVQADVWQAIELGTRGWRQDTDRRPEPPVRVAGERLMLDGGLEAEVLGVDRSAHRLLTLRLPELGKHLYRSAMPVQYSYMQADVPLRTVQAAWAGRPWAVEMPSAARLLHWSGVAALREKGVSVVCVTHAAGLSATGDAQLDARLPLPERYEIPAQTTQAVDQATGRVVAVGTSVVRALEGDLRLGRPGRGVTELVLGPGTPLGRVDGIVTNLHVPGESHFELLQAFAPRTALLGGVQQAARWGWLAHEFGDGMVIL